MDLNAIPGLTDMITNAELKDLFTKYSIEPRVAIPVPSDLLNMVRQDYAGNLAHIIAPEVYNAAPVEFREALMEAIMGVSRITQESIDKSLETLTAMPEGPLKSVMVDAFGSARAGMTHQEVLNVFLPRLMALGPLVKSGQVKRDDLLTMLSSAGLDAGAFIPQADPEEISDRNADARARLREKFRARRRGDN